MCQQRGLGALLLAIGLALAACSSSDVEPDCQGTARTPPPAVPAPGPSVPPTPVKLVIPDSGASASGTPVIEAR